MESNHKRGIGKEHPKSIQIQGFGVLTLFFIWIIDSFIVKFSISLTIYIPLLICLIISISLLIIGCVLIFGTGHILFHKKYYFPGLITTGIFSHTRHPLYLGVLIIYLGLIFFSFSFISIIGWIIVFILYDYLASFEKRELEKKYDKKYLEYKKKVPKWFPRI